MMKKVMPVSHARYYRFNFDLNLPTEYKTTIIATLHKNKKKLDASVTPTVAVPLILSRQQ